MPEEISNEAGVEAPVGGGEVETAGVQIVPDVGAAPVGEIGGGGDDAVAFLGTLSEELRAEPSLQRITNVQDLAKSYVSAQKLVGAEKIGRPQEGWTDEQHSEFYNSLGRPESADGYTLPELDATLYNQESLNGFKAAAHKLGLSQSQMSGIIEMYDGQLRSASGENTALEDQFYEQSASSLKAEWGHTYDMRIADANRAVTALGGDEVMQALEMTGLANHPGVVRMLSKVGRMIAEDGPPAGTPARFGMTPEQAQSKINANRRSKEFMDNWTKRGAVGHKEAVEEMNELFAAAEGTDSVEVIDVSLANFNQ